MRAPSWAWILVFGIVPACTSTIDIDVQIVDPCNQDAVQSVDFLKLEPRGDGVDMAGLTTVVEVGAGTSPAIRVPLTTNFQIVATGHKGDFNSAPSAIGVSAKVDISQASDRISIRLPFALVDNFYRTTSLETPEECSRLQEGRYGATATFLPDSGKVLVIGGARVEDGLLRYPRAIELYDPATGRFEVVGELTTGAARAFHTATLLSDEGRVLIAGGEAQVMAARQSLKSALIIDASNPANVTVSDAFVMREERTGHIAQRLADGRVVLAGGRKLSESGSRPQDHQYLSSIEIFDPERGAFTVPVNAAGAATQLSSARFGHTGTLLKTGHDIFIAGGMNSTGPVLSLEVIHVDGNTVTAIASSTTLGVGPIFHAADLTQTGAVLLSGGYGTIADAEPQTGLPMNASANVEMWEFKEAAPDADKFVRVCTAAMNAGRGLHTVSMSGRYAVFIGGRGGTGLPLASGEMATLAVGSNCFAGPPDLHMMTDARTQHAVTELKMSGELLVVGGRQQEALDPFGRSIVGAEVFSPRREP